MKRHIIKIRTKIRRRYVDQRMNEIMIAIRKATATEKGESAP